MTDKQKRFCDEYLIDCNARRAALAAGYAESTAAHHASCWLNGKDGGWQFKPELREYVDQQLEKIHNEKTADAQEVLEYLTSVLRGESSSSVLSLCGEGCQEVIDKHPDEKERLKAAELIGRRYGLFRGGLDMSLALPVVISGGDMLED